MSQLYETILDPHRRGTEFKYHFVLGNGWTASMFTGGMKFVLRRSIPPSSVVTDTDAVHVASLGDEITFSDTTHGTVLITGANCNEWPARELYWDLAGVVTVGNRKLDIDSGKIPIIGDIGRT